ncbi:MAG: DUF84 family protein [Acidobacteriota bacterium]
MHDPFRGTDTTAFWYHLTDGIEVAVASTESDKLLGVRDGFRRFFHDGLERPVAVAVVAQDLGEVGELPVRDEDILGLARRRADAVRTKLHATEDRYDFYVGAEAGLLSIVDPTAPAGAPRHHFVRTWTVIHGLDQTTFGSSGSVQLPASLIRGIDGDDDLAYAVPGTRRRGGMVSSLTGGLEDRRSATALATFNALATLLHGLLGPRMPAAQRR